jgi:hypothetical protein
MLRSLNLFHYKHPLKSFLSNGIMSLNTNITPFTQKFQTCNEMWKHYIQYIHSGVNNKLLGLYIFLTTTFKRKKLKMKKHKTWKRWKKIRNITKSNLKH